MPDPTGANPWVRYQGVNLNVRGRVPPKPLKSPGVTAGRPLPTADDPDTESKTLH